MAVMTAMPAAGSVSLYWIVTDWKIDNHPPYCVSWPMRRLVWLVGLAACGMAPTRSAGQYVISGGAVSETFQSFTSSGFSPSPSAGQLNSNSYAVTGWSDGDLDFGGTRATAGTDYTRGMSSGGVSTGGTYAFNVGGGDIALGVQPGASDFAPGAIYVKIKNTGSDFTGFAASFDRGVLNDQVRSSTFKFEVAVSSVNITTATQVASLSYVTLNSIISPTTADISPAWSLATVTANDTTTLVAQNSFLYLRWTSTDAPGGSGTARDEFAIASFSVTPVPEPATVLALAAGGLGLARRWRWLV